MKTTTMIQVRFSEQTEIGEFNDALYFTEEEFAGLKPEDIEIAAKSRVANWTEAVAAASKVVAVEPTVEELEAEVAQVQMEIDRLTAYKTERTAVLSARVVVKEPVVEPVRK